MFIWTTTATLWSAAARRVTGLFAGDRLTTRGVPKDCVSSNTTEPLRVAHCCLAVGPRCPRCLLTKMAPNKKSAHPHPSNFQQGHIENFAMVLLSSKWTPYEGWPSANFMNMNSFWMPQCSSWILPPMQPKMNASLMLASLLTSGGSATTSQNLFDSL